MMIEKNLCPSPTDNQREWKWKHTYTNYYKFTHIIIEIHSSYKKAE